MSSSEKVTAPRPRFDIKFMKAVLLRLMAEPHLCVKFKDYLDPSMFDIGDGKGSLKKITSVLLDWINTEDTTPTIEGIWGRLQLLPDGVERDNAIEVFNDIRTDKEIFNYSESDQIFQTFLQWLKATAFLQEYHVVKERFNSGSFDDAYSTMEYALSKIKGITLDEVEDAGWATSLNFLEIESQRPDRKFLFGIDDFDTQSGFEAQMLCLFVALTGGGKSMATVHLIRQAIEQEKHIYVACVEDRKVTVLRRVYAALTGIPMSDIKKLCDMPPDQRKKMIEVSKKLEKFVTIEFIYGQPLDFILARIKERIGMRRISGLPGYDAFVLDYLQHIAHLSPGDSMHEKLTLSMAKLKDFALANHIFCATHQQVNRSGAASQSRDGLITLSEMSASFQAAFVADVIMSINRTPDMRERDEAVFYVMKGREGAVDQKYQVKTQFNCARYDMSNYIRIDKMA